MKITIEVSARHCHLSQSDVDILFGPGYQLTADKPISQSGQFSCRESVAIEYEKKRIDHVRIVGPVRQKSQAELTRTELYQLGVGPTVGAVSVTAHGPQGSATIEAAIKPRHIHCDPLTAQQLGITNGQLVLVHVPGEHGVTFEQVIVRINKTFVFRCHLNTDEANAAGISRMAEGELII